MREDERASLQSLSVDAMEIEEMGIVGARRTGPGARQRNVHRSMIHNSHECLCNWPVVNLTNRFLSHDEKSAEFIFGALEGGLY